MRPSDFQDPTTGRLVDIGNGFSAFVPAPLPRGLSLPPRLTKLLGDTRAKLGRLNEGVGSLPSSQLFLRPFQKREAVLSSRIEGTVTTLDEAFVNDTVETEEELVDDAREVRNYERALHSGVGALADGRPLNVTLFKALHREVLRGVRGEEKQPGALRSRQAYVANRTVLVPDDARFVPPPPLDVVDCLDDFDAYLAERGPDEGLIRVALTHYQFETIHPFADGNGRTGRLLVALQLVWEGVLDHPFLYVSPTLERRRQAYYDGLLDVSQRGSFLNWAEFFVKAVSDSADETLARFGQLRDLTQKHEQLLKTQQSQKPLLLAKHLLASPYVTVQSAGRALESPDATAQKTIDKLVEIGILELTTMRVAGARGRPRKLYRCPDVLAIIRE